MDNRIPTIIKDFVSKNPNDTQIDFLSFNDWLSLNDNLSDDWVVIAQRGKITKYSDLFITSCLIQADSEGVEKFLSNSNWFISTTFGIPSKYQEPYEDEEYDDGLTGFLDNVKYTPFTFLRHFNTIIPDRFEIIQHFLLYHNAYWVEEKSEFHSISENGDIITLIKHTTDFENEKERVLVDAHCLKDYLAVKNCFLARFHYHRRRSSQDITNFIQGKFVTHALKNSNSYFELDLSTDIQYDDIKSTSSLLGKDLVSPYDEPISHEITFEKDESQFLEFIVSRNKKGKEVTSTCNPDKLSNYFTDKGTPDFLTPVYFKKELLQKYYAEPKKYEVSEGQIGYLNIWGIEYDITKENLIQVYLGDIGQRLPYSEQLHWRQYNVVPKGKISTHRFERDFLVKFSTPEIKEAPVSFFKQELEITQKLFADLYGDKLFKELSKNDLHYFDTLHIPLTDEWKELDEQILNISKITTDSFNGKVLSKITGKKIGDLSSGNTKIKGLLGLFYEYLLQKIGKQEIVDAIVEPFNMVQAMRSSSVAHRKSKEFVKTMNKYELSKFSNEDKMEKIIIGLITSLKLLNEQSKAGNNV